MAWPLSVAFPLTLAGAVVLTLAFDTAAAWYATVNPRVNFRRLWPAQFLLYITIGFVAMFAMLDIRRVEAIGAITAFVDATAGLAITWRLGPGRIDDPKPAHILIAILTVTAFGFGLGSL